MCCDEIWGESSVTFHLPKLKDLYLNFGLFFVDAESLNMVQECETVEFIVDMISRVRLFFKFPNARTVILPANAEDHDIVAWKRVAPKAKIITNFKQAKAAILARARTKSDVYTRELIKGIVQHVNEANTRISDKDRSSSSTSSSESSSSTD